MKFFALVCGFLGLASAAYAADATNWARQIVNCSVTDPDSPEEKGVRVEVYQMNDRESSLFVIYAKPNARKKLFPVDESNFSSDQTELTARFAKLIVVNIPKGEKTLGTMTVSSGGAASQLTCKASW